MAIQTTDFKFPNQTNIYRGKVRDVYTINDSLLVTIASDRISAFDVILPRPIPHKGQVLNQLASHFLQATADIAPNWLLATPHPNVSIGHKCQPFAIEMVIRGCLVGYSWRAYQAGKRELCDVALPEGMQEYDIFPEPIITPSTKAHEGHDEDISEAEILEKKLATQQQWQKLTELTRALFARGQEMARQQGLYLADTKYEFGMFNDEIYVIDEIHTPDSSRYFYEDSYQSYLQDRSLPLPKHLSKEFLRQWLLDHNFSGQPGQQIPEMDDEFVASVSDRYIELYERFSGSKFVPTEEEGELSAIEAATVDALNELDS